RFEAICGAVERQVSRLANDGGVTKSHGLAAQAAFDLLTGSTSAGSVAPHIGVLVDWETFIRGPIPTPFERPPLVVPCRRKRSPVWPAMR
ncbi:MAG: hypothetical protein OEZ14_03850, partial [Acidimicrobiia bacterium]|nr:hypothetical protein [Acidimicrobiia bacterium]